MTIPATQVQAVEPDSTQPEGLRCRFCNESLSQPFLDLGMSPLANSYVSPARANAMEPFFPLRVYLCQGCLLVQLQEFESPENIFGDYAYFSSVSSSWVEHARQFADYAARRFSLGPGSQVVEIASNDGYLLQFFLRAGIPVLGIEPAANIAEVAETRGIRTISTFFGESAARDLAPRLMADLLIGNNVLAHVPRLNDFVRGMSVLLKPEGVISMEFPHLMRLLAENQFDTIYHEHFSYFSLITVQRVFAAHGLRIFDVEELPTHGGSLRILACHRDASHARTSRVPDLEERERAAGITHPERYLEFAEGVKETKRKLLEFLIRAKRDGKSIAGYGAPAKGNTLLNYCGVRSDFLDYTVDMSPHKQGLLLPGTHLSICHPDRLRETKPDYILILPWNLRDEITQQMAWVREWGAKFVVPIPEVTVLP